MSNLENFFAKMISFSSTFLTELTHTSNCSIYIKKFGKNSGNMGNMNFREMGLKTGVGSK